MVEVVAALLWKENKFLIAKRPAHKARGGLWEFVGGKVEKGESKEEALVRECEEELACRILPTGEYMRVVHTYPDITVSLTLFHAELVEGEPQKIEHDSLAFISPKDIPLYEFCPADEEILKRIQADYPD